MAAIGTDYYVDGFKEVGACPHCRWLRQDIGMPGMRRTVSRIGDDFSIILDGALLEFAGLTLGDAVDVVAADAGGLRITPIRPKAEHQDVGLTIKSTMGAYRRTLKKLS